MNLEWMMPDIAGKTSIIFIGIKRTHLLPLFLPPYFLPPFLKLKNWKTWANWNCCTFCLLTQLSDAAFTWACLWQLWGWWASGNTVSASTVRPGGAGTPTQMSTQPGNHAPERQTSPSSLHALSGSQEYPPSILFLISVSSVGNCAYFYKSWH